jgi:hypothetical protein
VDLEKMGIASGVFARRQRRAGEGVMLTRFEVRGGLQRASAGLCPFVQHGRLAMLAGAQLLMMSRTFLEERSFYVPRGI